MGTRLRTAVDTISIVNGKLQEKVSNVGIIEPSSIIPIRRGRGSLYILVETIGGFPDHAQIQQRIIQAVQEHYRTSGSITAGIRLAIKNANDYLFEENLNAPPEQRGIAGITCLVLRDRDAYIGQIGPALLYQVSKEELQRLPRESSWLTSRSLQDVDISEHPPLGLRRDIEPELDHLYIKDGDILILASLSLAKLASDDKIASAAMYRSASTVRDNLESLAQGQNLSALIIEVLKADQALVQEEKEPTSTTAKERPKIWTRVYSAIRSALVPPPEPDLEQAEEWEEEEERFSLITGLKDAAESARHALIQVGQALIVLLTRMLPEAEPKQRAKRRKAKGISAGSTNTWLWIALLTPVLIILLFAFARYQYEHSRQTQFTQLLQAALDAKASAEANPVTTEKRAGLHEALTLLDEALQLKPENEEALLERQAIQAQLDDINLVSRIFYFSELKEFPDTQSAKSQPGTVIVHGIDVYVLDLGTNRVYKYLLNQAGDGLQDMEGDPVLLRKGDQHDQVVVDELLDIVWVEAGGERGTSNLLILDKKGHILEYDPWTGLKPLPIADDSMWHKPIAAAAYYGNLYLLDPPANRILKYQPTSRGYDLPAIDYFKEDAGANVSNAVDMAIDGNVYVLQADGTISKYLSGAAVPFPQGNLDEPLKAPTCIFASGTLEDSGYVYVADAGNQRIVQFNKDGEFIRQFRSQEPEYMDNLRSIFVDEATRKLYLVNGSKLYLANLPE